MSRSSQRRIHHCGCDICRGHPYGSVAVQHRAINRVLVSLDEKNRRRFVGLLALQQGERSIAPLTCITGLSRNTIYRGKREIAHPSPKPRGRVRAPGAGRPLTEKNNRVFSMRSTSS